jgi:hypothetical protein
MFPEKGSIVASISEEEDDTVDPAVHLLAFDPSLEGLQITRARFGLDTD